jgi:hypothetical protein
MSGALLMFISAEVLEGEFSVSFLVWNSVQLQSQPSSMCTNVVNLGRTYKSLFMWKWWNGLWSDFSVTDNSLASCSAFALHCWIISSQIT